MKGRKKRTGSVFSLVAELTAQLGNQAGADFDMLVDEGLDADLLFAHLKQVESALSQTSDPPEWTRWLLKAPRIAKNLERLADVIEELDRQGLFNPQAFVRVYKACSTGNLPFLVQVAATAQMPHLPQAMRSRAELLDRQLEAIGRWRRGWLRGNFALTQSVQLLAAYVGSECTSMKRWKLLADLLNALAKSKSAGVSFTPDDLRLRFARRLTPSKPQSLTSQ